MRFNLSLTKVLYSLIDVPHSLFQRGNLFYLQVEFRQFFIVSIAWTISAVVPNQNEMTEAYHNEALRKQRIVDKKHAALARIKYGEVRLV